MYTTVLKIYSGYCQLNTVKWKPRSRKIFGWTFLKKTGFEALYLAYPSSRWLIAREVITAVYLVRVATTKESRDRPTIMKNRMMMVTHYNTTRMKTKVYQNSKTWYHLRKITAVVNINSGCPISVISTASQQGILTSKSINSPYKFRWTSRPNREVRSWQISGV